MFHNLCRDQHEIIFEKKNLGGKKNLGEKKNLVGKRKPWCGKKLGGEKRNLGGKKNLGEKSLGGKKKNLVGKPWLIAVHLCPARKTFDA